MFDTVPEGGWGNGGGTGWSVVDPQPIKQNAPYTFFLPSAAELAAMRPGDRVQLGLAPDGFFEGAAERVWVRLAEVTAEGCTGTPDGEIPPGLSADNSLSFMPRHIWAVSEMRVDDLEEEMRYLAGAHMDPLILTGAADVGWLERRASHAGKGAYPETGWYAFAEGSDGGGSLYHGPIGLLLNFEDRMMPLLRAPVGARLERWDGGWRRVA